MEYALLAGPRGDATLDLDHRQFPLAGDFVQPRGVAVASDPCGDGEPAGVGEPGDDENTGGDRDPRTVGATTFDPDRSTADAVRIRAITVREGRRGQGIGARLAAFTRAALHERGWNRVLIAVATPVAYHALHKAGFADTGTTTGLRERVLAHPPPADAVPYATGLRWYLDHDPSSAERSFVEARAGAGAPDTVPVPPGAE